MYIHIYNIYTYIYIYVYMYINVCVCVCSVCIHTNRPTFRACYISFSKLKGLYYIKHFAFI